ncbi:MAG TPA: trypsin-like peptidase domain-containing protein [Solirubrobacteraceae bacterium]|nr:trypsin-like peptidase domain-containing protein [Solirubrobacteraceae bacterium]
MTGNGRPRHMLLRGVLITAVAAIVGVVAGHFIWSASPTLRLTPASSRSVGVFGPSGTSRGLGAGEGAGEQGAGQGSAGGRYGYGGGLFGPGSSGESGGSGESRGSGESGGSGEAGGFGEGGSSNAGVGSGERSSEGGGSGENGESGSAGSAGSTGGVSSAVTTKVDPALVDIDTDLGLEGGEAAGTGMVVTPEGEVITNNHVITGATKITATDVGSGTTYPARVVGYSHNHDIAVLQLEGASNLKTVSIGDATSLQVGQGIATIGNAGGVGGTPSATSGQIAALDQSITAGDDIDGTQEHLSGLIQLNGDLQPGDSGGPLVNGAGEVVGMDTAASSTFQFESSADEGFAIPINQVETIAHEIGEGQSSGGVHIGATGMLGVLIQSQGSEGALVEDVLSGGPAAGAGLTGGDLITGLDGSAVSSPTVLTDLLLEKHPGDRVTVSWQTREGVRQTATITLASGPPQ